MALAEVNGRKIYYELHPDEPVAGKTPLVLAAGMAGSCRGWLPLQVPAFSASRPVLVFNYRGVSGSEDPGGDFTTKDLADDLVGLLDALGIEQVDLLGSFLGGMVGQQVALAYPERVRHLVLLGTYARPDGRRRLILEDWASLARAGISSELLLRLRLAWTLEDSTFDETDLVAGMVEFFEKQGAPVSDDVFIRQCEACLGHDTLERLGEIAHQTLILCGRHDRLTPPDMHRQLAEAIPSSRLVVMQFGGHLVMAEAAERFNQVVLQFLDSESS